MKHWPGVSRGSYPNHERDRCRQECEVLRHDGASPILLTPNRSGTPVRRDCGMDSSEQKSEVCSVFRCRRSGASLCHRTVIIARPIFRDNHLLGGSFRSPPASTSQLGRRPRPVHGLRYFAATLPPLPRRPPNSSATLNPETRAISFIFARISLRSSVCFSAMILSASLQSR
jgi:hypothetical protein